MKNLLAIILVAMLSPDVWAGVAARVYLGDEKTPLGLVDPNVPDLYRDIMVGTRLTIFIESDVTEFSMGALRVAWEDQSQGFLAGRGFEQALKLGSNELADAGIYRNSCLEAAGVVSMATKARSMSGIGLDFGTDLFPEPGRWFVFDYYATGVGICEVDRYEYDPPFVYHGQILTFTQVPSRDFNHDTAVNFADFAHLASQWDGPAAADPNLNGSADLDGDDWVGTLDMLHFGDYWLQRTDFNEPDPATTSDAWGQPTVP